MKPNGLVLATDLDGTLAAGERAEREVLLEGLHRDLDATLIYVTGRTPTSARALIAREQLPAPCILIADVGTTVLRGLGPEHVVELEPDLGAHWPGLDPVRARLAHIEALELQPIDAPRRASYWITQNRELRQSHSGPDDFDARKPDDDSLSENARQTAALVARRASAALQGLSVDVLVSGNVYLDVLPRGVHKGSTLQRVLEYLGLEPASCIVAGDSLNDRALFEIGARGIIVGNCEPALRHALTESSNLYFARQAGAGGILEGLRHLGVMPAWAEPAESEGRNAQ